MLTIISDDEAGTLSRQTKDSLRPSRPHSELSHDQYSADNIPFLEGIFERKIFFDDFFFWPIITICIRLLRAPYQASAGHHPRIKRGLEKI